MNIALVILHADPERGGAERYTTDLARALSAGGHQVSLLASTFGDVPNGVRAVGLDALGLTKLRQYARFLDSLDRHLSETKYDVIHAMLPVRRCDFYHPHAGIAAEAIESGHLKHDGRVRQRAAHLFNRFNRKRRRFADVERDLLTSAKAPVVLCLSNYIKDAVLCHYELPPSRLVTLFNGIDTNRYDPARDAGAGSAIRQRFNLSGDRTVALMVAQDFQRKGLRQAIEALAQVRDTRLLLLVVGRPDPTAYRALARKWDVEQQVIFAGPTTSVYDFYRAADFFVLPTRHDPCSLVVLEALAMGLPVITTAANGASEIMSDGREGFVITDPADIASLAAAMTSLLDSSRRALMGRAALDLRPRLSFTSHVQSLLGLYARF